MLVSFASDRGNGSCAMIPKMVVGNTIDRATTNGGSNANRHWDHKTARGRSHTTRPLSTIQAKTNWAARNARRTNRNVLEWTSASPGCQVGSIGRTVKPGCDAIISGRGPVHNSTRSPRAASAVPNSKAYWNSPPDGESSTNTIGLALMSTSAPA